ncbi:hypothetical protein BLNAU_19341 [Blattamonas nauphoetae]|uniref:Uncharacterized protein n=1 Tax=Blattamonas nauphoetae TaxID=2049346 RepID=A0ABQ9X1S5_9EUKA|nr:hypothetical protein BLNAU_19341 [Blattamonas nauphoetae]
MSVLEYLDELPTRCAIAESCGLVSVLSDIVSSQSSIGLRSIASSLLALIQNALGSCEVQTKEHRHLNSQVESTMNKPVDDVKEQLFELHTTVCNMATQMAEQFGRMDSRLMKHDTILNQLNEKRRSDLLRESRLRRWSKSGADAIEIFDEDFIIKTGNTFTLRPRTETEDTNFIPKTLFSPIITSDVAQLSFTITHLYYGYSYGAVNPHLLDTGTKHDIGDERRGQGAWRKNYEPPTAFRAFRAPRYRYSREFVLEADCREGQRTLKCLKDRTMKSDFYINLSLPFRFAINLLHPSISVTINSLTFTTVPTLKGGKNELEFRP